jgi:hypothetical protein
MFFLHGVQNATAAGFLHPAAVSVKTESRGLIFDPPPAFAHF